MRRVLRLCRVAFSSLGRRLPFRVVTPATLFHVWGARQWPSRIATRLSGPALGGSDRWGVGASAVVRAETHRERPLGSTASVRSVLRPDCADGVKSGCSRGTAERLQVDAHTHRVGVGARGGLAHLPRSRPPGCSSRVAGQWLRRGSCLSATRLGPRGTPTKEPPQTGESRSPAGCLFSASVPGRSDRPIMQREREAQVPQFPEPRCAGSPREGTRPWRDRDALEPTIRSAHAASEPSSWSTGKRFIDWPFQWMVPSGMINVTTRCSSITRIQPPSWTW